VTLPRPTPTLLCLDVGLTNVKAVLVTDDGRVVALALRSYPTRRGPFAEAEQDPNDWWQAIGSATAELATHAGHAWNDVSGIAVTAHMHGLVALDRARRPVGPALVLGDRRAVDDAEVITKVLGDATIHEITGSTMDATMPAAKIRWLRRMQPERFDQAEMFTSVKDHVRGRLVVGDHWTESIDACATALWDIHRREWSEPILDLVGIGRDRLPDVVPATTATQRLSVEAARHLGLVAGIPVVVGAGDDIEVVGCGLVEPGGALEHLGTTGSILKVIATPIHDPALALELYPHAIDGLWVIGGSMTTAGAAIDWAAAVLGARRAGKRPELTIDDPVFLPGLAGERCPTRNPNARGAWLGMSLGVSRATLTESVHEGVVFALRRIVEATVDLTGSIDQLIVSAGGGAAAPDAVQARADLLGRTLTVSESPEPTAQGLATVIAAGIGLYDDLPAAATAMVRGHREFDPNPRASALSEARYARFRILADALDVVW
jgi:xylulokinase